MIDHVFEVKARACHDSLPWSIIRVVDRQAARVITIHFHERLI